MKGKNIALVVMAIVICALAAALVYVARFGTKSVSAPTPTPTTSPTVTPKPSIDTTQPLSARVRVTTPKAGAVVTPSFAVKGEAPGNWFFEASFPIQVRDGEGSVIGRAVAQAKSDWMTTKQVPFEATVTVQSGYHGPATLILLKDNPSGLPEHDDSVSFDITVQ